MSRMRFLSAVPLALILALALLALSAHDYWTSPDLSTRALAGLSAGLLGALAALRLGRPRVRPVPAAAEIPAPARAPLAFEAVRPAGDRKASREPAPTTVLVIDGHDESRELLARGLAREGVHVITAADWEQGLRRARDVRPDLITLDALLPESDAWAMLRALKEDAETAHIPVIMTTLQNERTDAEEPSSHECLPLPVEPARLLGALGRHRAGDGDASVLLVVEDAALRSDLAEMLGGHGWMVMEAEGPRLGLQLLAGALPDVVVLHLDVPGRQGAEFLAALRGQPSWSGIPVVALSARELSGEERSALEGRAARVFQKSALSSHELARQIQGLLAGGRGAAPARRADAS
jgi:CheY-like chemotaxis protein